MLKVDSVYLPNKPLTNFDLESAARKLKIPNFRGTFSRDSLPEKPRRKESGILNLDNRLGGGSHWVAWYKNNKQKCYFDSFGLHPPMELVKYLGPGVEYNTERVQRPDTVICGHLCLYWLKELSRGKDPQKVINTLF